MSESDPPPRLIWSKPLFTRAGVIIVALGVAAVVSLPGVPGPTPTPANILPLTRIVLSSAGLGQFGYEGLASAGSRISLPVRRDQVDDVLKSLTLFDPAGGLGPVSLPGRDPLEELFRDLPFGREALNSPPALLNALVGSEVELSGPVSARGRIFKVEPEKVALPDNGGTLTQHRLSLMTEKGLVQAVLEEATSLKFTDPAARGQIDRALRAMAENRARDRRQISIEILGQDSRPVALTYVVAAPIWKTSWRLVLGGSEGKARLQGWAILENMTGGDWSDVDLTLVSGDPVALTQPLYTAMFGQQIPVPLPVGPRLAPRPDDTVAAAPMLAAPAPRAAFRAEKVASGAAPAREDASPPAPLLAEAQDQTAQILYHFPGKVSLATGHTLMIPLVDREIPAERVWLYQPETNGTHPLVALRLRNESDSALPPGIVTAYDLSSGSARHVGDAMLPLVPRDSSKFLALALDSATALHRDDQGIQQRRIGTLAGGKLTTTTRFRHVIAYEITPPPGEERALVIEESRTPGWDPAADQPGVETAGSVHRWRITAPPGQITRASFVTEQTGQETVILSDLPPEEILVQISGLENSSPALNDTIARLSALVATITRAQSQRDRTEEERGRILQDQERIRANLQSVGLTGDLGQRYLQTLRGQENRLAEIERQTQTLAETVAVNRKACEDLIAGLTL